MKNLFLNHDEINNFDQMVIVILSEGISPNSLNIEHIGDIINIANSYDKTWEHDDPELKKVVATVVKALLDSGQVSLCWEYSWPEEVRKKHPTSVEGTFEVLNDYWDKTDELGLDRSYLMWFKKKI